MLLHITQEHIDRGERDSNTRCPVALAMRDVFGEDSHISADYGNANVSYPLHGYPFTPLRTSYYRVPKNMALWMEAFDDGKPVKPCAFEVEPRLRT